MKYSSYINKFAMNRVDLKKPFPSLRKLSSHLNKNKKLLINKSRHTLFEYLIDKFIKCVE